MIRYFTFPWNRKLRILPFYRIQFDPLWGNAVNKFSRSSVSLAVGIVMMLWKVFWDLSLCIPKSSCQKERFWSMVLISHNQAFRIFVSKCLSKGTISDGWFASNINSSAHYPLVSVTHYSPIWIAWTTLILCMTWHLSSQ